MKMEMPDTIEIYKHYTVISPHKTEYELELWKADYDHSDGETYHHSRVVESLRRENEELKAKLDANEKLMDESADKLIKSNAEITQAFEMMKAKLDKAIDALRFLTKSDGPIGNYARTTLEEIG